MSDNKLKVSVIGLGNIGKVVASNLVKGNREVTVASHKIEDAKALASNLGPRAKATDVKTAIKIKVLADITMLQSKLLLEKKMRIELCPDKIFFLLIQWN